MRWPRGSDWIAPRTSSDTGGRSVDEAFRLRGGEGAEEHTVHDGAYADGGTLLFWYYAVLAFPLTVVVPYAAFRSLAAEREDNTYDLLSITSRKPRQIISGKLASADNPNAIFEVFRSGNAPTEIFEDAPSAPFNQQGEEEYLPAQPF